MNEFEDLVAAIKSMLNHREREAAAAEQRDAELVRLHASGHSYDALSRAARSMMLARGFSEAQINEAGISTHNIRRSVRAART